MRFRAPFLNDAARAAAFLGILLFMAVPVHAQKNAKAWDGTDHFRFDYGVYGGGFQALDIDITIRLEHDSYSADMNAKPYGVLGKLLPWAGHYETRGHVRNGTLTPAFHKKTSAWRDDRDTMAMTYHNGVLTDVKKTSHDDNVTETLHPKPAFHENTVDLVTDIIALLNHASLHDSCDFAQDVFDGKRRFRMVFTDHGVESLAESKLNIFQGEARRCTLELIPQQGFNPKKKPRGFYKIQEDARKQGTLPTLWMGRLWQDGPLIPVRMMVKSEYGTVLVHLNNAKRQ